MHCTAPTAHGAPRATKQRALQKGGWARVKRTRGRRARPCRRTRCRCPLSCTLRSLPLRGVGAAGRTPAGVHFRGTGGERRGTCRVPLAATPDKTGVCRAPWRPARACPRPKARAAAAHGLACSAALGAGSNWTQHHAVRVRVRVPWIGGCARARAVPHLEDVVCGDGAKARVRGLQVVERLAHIPLR